MRGGTGEATKGRSAWTSLRERYSGQLAKKLVICETGIIDNELRWGDIRYSSLNGAMRSLMGGWKSRSRRKGCSRPSLGGDEIKMLLSQGVNATGDRRQAESNSARDIQRKVARGWGEKASRLERGSRALDGGGLGFSCHGLRVVLWRSPVSAGVSPERGFAESFEKILQTKNSTLDLAVKNGSPTWVEWAMRSSGETHEQIPANVRRWRNSDEGEN